MASYKVSRTPQQKIQDTIRTLFRALGMGLIIGAIRSTYRKVMGKSFEEPTKIAMRKSRITALLRTAIHIVPLSVALWEISTNLRTYYVGPNIQSQGYYQFAAKIHEMSAQASLASIVFSYVGYEMSLGQGLPFGALFSGLQVSQPSYLCSMELWGSICSTYIPLKRRAVMVEIISLAVVLTATVGPSSAILLIPRLGYWPAGSTDIWINATLEDLWPARTNGTLVPTSCRTSDALPVANVCPSSQWQAIQTYLNFTDKLAPLIRQDFSPSSVEVTGKYSFRRLVISRQSPVNSGPGYDPLTAVATSQQAAVADALTATGTWWQLGLPNITTNGHGNIGQQLDVEHSIVSGYYQPYTIVSCEQDVIEGFEDDSPVAFPPPPGSIAQMLNTTAFNDSILTVDALPVDSLVFPKLTKHQLLSTAGPLDQNRLRWVELPQDPFNGTAIGVVVLLPRSPTNATQKILMCNVGAGWGSSTLDTSSLPGAPGNVLSQVNTESTGLNPLPRNVSSVESVVVGNIAGYFLLPYFPQRPVTLTEDWAEFLNPSLIYATTTVFNTLMGSDLTDVDPSVSARIILAGLVANGLSRIGSSSQLQGSVETIDQPDGTVAPVSMDYWYSGKGNIFKVNASESKDWVKFRVFSTVEGYAYNASGFTPKLAICILLIYCLFAILHVIYAGILGLSSTCWGSIAEVTALAVNSTPTAALRNTCAGITGLGIFKLPVRVLAAQGPKDHGDHLELVFENTDEKTVEHRTIKTDRLYGTMPPSKDHRKLL